MILYDRHGLSPAANRRDSDDPTKRILFITNNLGGGTGNHLVSMIKTWDKSRWNPEIICQGPIAVRLPADLPVKSGPPDYWVKRYPISQFRCLIQIKQYIENYSPDIVHCYFFWPIIYGRILKRLGKIHFLIENREDQGFNWGKHEYALLRFTRSIPDRVICVSEAVQQVVLSKEGLDPNRTVVIHNGVRIPQDFNVNKLSILNELGIKDKNLIVGMVANLNRAVKGVSYFLDAIPLIMKGVPEARFLIIGEGDEEQFLRKRARELAIERYVMFTGYRDDMDRLYPVMDISVLTSLSEGLSITLLESMSYGLPVIVTRVGGNPEVVIDGETGYLVPPKDVLAFARRVIELLRNPNLRNRMGENGKQRVKEWFSLDETAKRYLEVYEGLLQQRA